jgi:hypothetical protein
MLQKERNKWQQGHQIKSRMGNHTIWLHPHAKGTSIKLADWYMYQRHMATYIDPDDGDGVAGQLAEVASV